MAYVGQLALFNFGARGIVSDAADTRLPIDSFKRGQNFTVSNNVLEKEFGTEKFNQTALEAGIVSTIDWFPDEITQRQISVIRNGKVFKFNNRVETVEVTATAPAPATLMATDQVHIVEGGNELPGNARKLFIFTGSDPVQVIEADAVTRSNIDGPPADWATTNQPKFGIVHRDRLVAFGNKNSPHRFYMSDPDNHEDFVTDSLQFNVYPGESDGLETAFVFKGRLFLLKKPTGLYLLDDTDSDTANWQINKLSDEFGAGSIHSALTVLDDVLVSNDYGSVTSIAAVQAFGDVRAADVFRQLATETFVRQNTSKTTNKIWSMYYKEKKQCYFTRQTSDSQTNNRFIIFDFNLRENTRMLFSTKDQPNCLALKKDILGIDRPTYGAEDGFLHIMDRETREVDGTTAISLEAETPHWDMSHLDPRIGNTNKIFDFLEITYLQEGSFTVDVEVFIDGISRETISFDLAKQNVLDAMKLDEDRLDSGNPFQRRKLAHGHGRRIGLKFKNSGAKQNIRIVSAGIYFRLAGQTQKR